MSARVISDPAAAGWALDPSTGYWMWKSGSGGYDDTEIRGLISDNATAISDNATAISDNATAISENSDRITALENDTGGAVDAYTKAEADAKYVPKVGNTTITGTLTATDFVATG